MEMFPLCYLTSRGASGCVAVGSPCSTGPALVHPAEEEGQAAQLRWSSPGHLPGGISVLTQQVPRQAILEDFGFCIGP